MENTEEKGIFSKIYNWFSNLTVKGLLGMILLAFIIIIVLISASYLPGIMSKISSSLSAALYSVFVPAENATMTADKKTINSGEDFNINFNKGDTTDGLFTISYACSSKTELLSVENNGLKKIKCDTPYYLLDDETNITVRPLTEDSIVRLAIEGAFENNENQKIEKVGVIRVTIKNDAVGTIVIPPTDTNAVSTTTATSSVSVITNTTTYVPPVQSVYYGKPDLAVRVLQVGLLNSLTNLISTQSQFSYQDMVGIKFEVRNDGTESIGPWSFTAVLPSLSTPTFNSNTQISLRPGESIIFTLGFSNLTNQSTSLITINADPQNLVNEDIEYNNIITSTITNLSYNSSYYNNNSTTGCYVNGYFTYDCYNNYNYNNDLQVSCSASPSNPDTGDHVHWYADVSGGDGDYEYDWYGSEGLDSSSESPSMNYEDDGMKYATVVVKSDSDTASWTCSVDVD